MSSSLDRARTVAPPGYNRALIPPAALGVHLSIGQACAFSTFNLPLSKLIGLSQSAPEDWKLTQLGWIFSIAIAFLGLSAALFGRWVEGGGPRRVMFVATLCFSGDSSSRRSASRSTSSGDHARQRALGRGGADAAILPALGRALPQRDGRHRRARPSLADDP